MVFVTGTSYGGSATGSDYATAAYSTATGVQLWVSRYNGAGNGDDNAAAVRVSPDGATVFVTGASLEQGTGGDYATIAYRAATGATLWVSRYNGPGNGDDTATGLSVAPDGTKVFATGSSGAAAGGIRNYATVAYQAATGAQQWVSRYTGPEGEDIANAVISPGGNRVFVTGSSRGGGSEATYTTIAYNATTGSQLWLRRYHGTGGYYDVATALVASPDLSRVFVTGRSFTSSEGNYATVAYRATTGATLWVSRYNGPGRGNDYANAVAVARDGTKVFVTGTSYGRTNDYATVAYRAATGAQLWVKRYNGPGNRDDSASSVMSPGNGTVYVTGASRGASTGRDYATIAYRATTGATLWVKRYNGPGNGGDEATSLAMSPDLTRLFVTGGSGGTTSDSDYATIAYQR